MQTTLGTAGMTLRAAAFHFTVRLHYRAQAYQENKFPKISFQGFKLDFMEEGGVLLRNGRVMEHCHFRKQWREASHFFQRLLGGLLQESNMSEKTVEVPLNQ